MTHPAIEAVARAVATENGDNYDQVPESKADWIDCRGMAEGRFRDVNEPFRNDYDDMARAAILAFLEVAREPSEGMGEYASIEVYGSANDAEDVQQAIWDTSRQVYQAMIDQLRKEIEG